MSGQEPTLVGPAEELKAEFLEMAREFSSAGEDRYQDALDDFPAYIRRLLDGARGVGLAPGRAPYSTFWLTSGRRLIGRSSLRHHLTADLTYEGGHVGYDIRPSERRKGYGILILRRTLEEARMLGLNRVLLTCDIDNVASAKVIERNGGRLQDQAVSKVSGKLISRYWIEL
jgi:predicted acetyltransferase